MLLAPAEGREAVVAAANACALSKKLGICPGTPACDTPPVLDRDAASVEVVEPAAGAAESHRRFLFLSAFLDFSAAAGGDAGAGAAVLAAGEEEEEAVEEEDEKEDLGEEEEEDEEEDLL